MCRPAVCLLVWYSPAPYSISDLHLVSNNLHQCKWLLWLVIQAFPSWHASIIGKRLKTTRYERYLAWQHSQVKPSKRWRCCWFHHTAPESLRWKKNSLLPSFSDCKQTDREHSWYWSAEAKNNVQRHQASGSGLVCFIKCKHFQLRNSSKWEKSIAMADGIDRKPMRKERANNSCFSFFHFFCFKFLKLSLLLCSQLRIDDRVCWMMELFSHDGGCIPWLWLWHETMASSPWCSLP